MKIVFGLGRKKRQPKLLHHFWSLTPLLTLCFSSIFYLSFLDNLYGQSVFENGSPKELVLNSNLNKLRIDQRTYLYLILKIPWNISLPSFPHWATKYLVMLGEGPNLFFKYFFLEFGMTLIWPIFGDLPRSKLFWEVESPKEPDCVQKEFCCEATRNFVATICHFN